MASYWAQVGRRIPYHQIWEANMQPLGVNIKHAKQIKCDIKFNTSIIQCPIGKDFF